MFSNPRCHFPFLFVFLSFFMLFDGCLNEFTVEHNFKKSSRSSQKFEVIYARLFHKKDWRKSFQLHQSSGLPRNVRDPGKKRCQWHSSKSSSYVTSTKNFVERDCARSVMWRHQQQMVMKTQVSGTWLVWAVSMDLMDLDSCQKTTYVGKVDAIRAKN